MKEDIERLEAQVELLNDLVLRLAVAAVGPEDFDDVHAYVAEVFAFAESHPDADPATEAEIDILTTLVLEAYDFDVEVGEDDDDEEDEDDG